TSQRADGLAGLCGEAAHAVMVQPEAIADKAELSDVAPPVDQQLGDPDGAGDDTVPAIGNIALCVDFLVAREAASSLDPFERREGICVRHMRAWRSTPIGAPSISLHRHGATPSLGALTIALSASGWNQSEYGSTVR